MQAETSSWVWTPSEGDSLCESSPLYGLCSWPEAAQQARGWVHALTPGSEARNTSRHEFHPFAQGPYLMLTDFAREQITAAIRNILDRYSIRSDAREMGASPVAAWWSAPICRQSLDGADKSDLPDYRAGVEPVTMCQLEACTKFRQGISTLQGNVRPVAFVRAGRVHLWAVFQSEPDFDLDTAAAEVFTSLYREYPDIDYDYLAITEREYADRRAQLE